MKKLSLLILIAILIIPIISVSVSAEKPIEIEILGNSGLTQYSNTNYTFNCEEANSNILSIVVSQHEGYTYITISHIIENIWLEQDFQILDQVENIYSIQFSGNGLYRIRVIRGNMTGNATYRDFYIKIIGGDGTYASGDIDKLIEMGRWVEDMMLMFDKENFDQFKEWAYGACRFFAWPFYVFTDFFIEIPMFLLMPHTWFIILIVIGLVILKYRKRIHITRKDRELSKKYGTRENLILDKRKAEEESRLHRLNTMPTDYALEKYGSGDYLSRSTCYHGGVPKIGVTYPTAYSLAFELGGSLFSTNEKRRKRAEEIIDALVEAFEPILEKAYIYGDIAACARAVSAESVEAKARTIIKDDFIKIAEYAEEKAKLETTELSKKLKIKIKEERGVGETISNIEKSIDKKRDKIGATDKK